MLTSSANGASTWKVLWSNWWWKSSLRGWSFLNVVVFMIHPNVTSHQKIHHTPTLHAEICWSSYCWSHDEFHPLNIVVWTEALNMQHFWGPSWGSWNSRMFGNMYKWSSSPKASCWLIKFFLKLKLLPHIQEYIQFGFNKAFKNSCKHMMLNKDHVPFPFCPPSSVPLTSWDAVNNNEVATNNSPNRGMA